MITLSGFDCIKKVDLTVSASDQLPDFLAASGHEDGEADCHLEAVLREGEAFPEVEVDSDDERD